MQNTVEVLNEISSELKRSRARYTPPSKELQEDGTAHSHSPLRQSHAAFGISSARSPTRSSYSPIRIEEEYNSKSDDQA
jgi:hypothetical protein